MGTHARPTSAPTGLAADWRSQPLALRVLRAFLGITFVYAGVQKFADPNFLHAGTPDYIGNQLQAFATGSPIGPVLRLFAHLPLLTGAGIALLEIAIGVGTLLGVARVAAAAAGFGVSLVLFLSATWKVHPYFLGSDSMYAVAWLAYLAGLWEGARRRAAVPASRRRSVQAAASSDLARRQVLRGALVGGATILLAGLGRVVMGSPSASASGFLRPTPGRGAGAGPHGTKHRQGASGKPSPSQSPTGTKPRPNPDPKRTKHQPTPGSGGHPTPGPSARPTSGGSSVQGRAIASLESLPVGGAVAFSGPGGEPCALFRLGTDTVAAFSRICTHAGCEVGYDSGSRLLVCPCHGAEFDPSRGAEPVAGPTSTPLPPVKVVIDHSRGEIVIPS
jgi:thiosulfate dehydrogenase (quinone) large subunit